ncbi:hypothetical protein [Deinococcus soli (ex Cha et al. 2016)]|uniref:Uncharacterized protein n=2 Tax=Deinococcus soli (ex Cha et al. 2016) TaxID=1309411 RepID=A0AAE3XFX6_9DEIO|nr:hypothetical protein [Deinococcus soli (ex Cha et al. 2016)]MDR6218983.1 hypothetical protein [Deinococcus soli (ex Cha et al. 2016)]MDR6328780.1 hypothetical protein [Deinococcus soli (ex Cha et al. 2016)]MDR6751733.1 hypothetical protein [Deinococcus soli (ex Cha et al. 2016)]
MTNQTPDQERRELERRGFKLSPCCARPTAFITERGERDLRRCPCGKVHLM